jgi:hypothetical protein
LIPIILASSTKKFDIKIAGQKINSNGIEMAVYCCFISAMNCHKMKISSTVVLFLISSLAMETLTKVYATIDTMGPCILFITISTDTNN